MPEIIGLDHVQLAMPAGQESLARQFYSGVLGLVEEPKPANLAKRGGVWFKSGSLRFHLGVDSDFRPARKAHPAFLVKGLAALAELVDQPDILRRLMNPWKASIGCMSSTHSATGLN